MKKIHLSIRMRFILMIMSELICVSFVSWLVMDVLHISDIPYTVWIIISSVIAGIVLNNFLSIRYFGPVLKLKKAMQQVAEGDFSIRLKAGNELEEIQDIYTNFNRMVQELEATEILQTDFVSNVSHEFKTPISAIEGYATLLQNSEVPVSGEQEEYIDKILFNTRRLSHLAGNILLLSKIEHQSIQTRQNWYRLDEQIRQSIVLLEPDWSKKEIEFDVDMVDVEYMGNESLISHVWDNLLSNSVKFSPVGGTIHIRMVPEGKKILFSIENEGPWISEDALKHIFDKFYQEDSSHKQEGNGLGLALVKQILNLCKGSITAENIPDGGCRFTVTL
ncbi:HAMP domain-containing sensor histidine kinase [Blautia sp. CLA-JM-H16]|uniref:Heme sensor protein HssS n=1 Tax=Blautia aquisgranensis TaxID=3133153 RepID=A0ABV1BIW5_9FIRM